jgi:hypothetical protein
MFPSELPPQTPSVCVPPLVKETKCRTHTKPQNTKASEPNCYKHSHTSRTLHYFMNAILGEAESPRSISHVSCHKTQMLLGPSLSRSSGFDDRVTQSIDWEDFICFNHRQSFRSFKFDLLGLFPNIWNLLFLENSYLMQFVLQQTVTG